MRTFTCRSTFLYGIMAQILQGTTGEGEHGPSASACHGRLLTPGLLFRGPQQQQHGGGHTPTGGGHAPPQRAPASGAHRSPSAQRPAAGGPQSSLHGRATKGKNAAQIVPDSDAVAVRSLPRDGGRERGRPSSATAAGAAAGAACWRRERAGGCSAATTAGSEPTGGASPGYQAGGRRRRTQKDAELIFLFRSATYRDFLKIICSIQKFSK